MASILYTTCMIVCCLCSNSDTSHDNPEVEIRQGKLRGVVGYTWKGKEFRAFTGIPYAEPPVGERRFEPPTPAKSWKGILDATKPHAICTQVNALIGSFTPEGEEDCLYLNVYTPLVDEFDSSKLPVMVYIHGGGWSSGSGNRQEYGPDYLLEEEIVLVVINYRIGAFGFLSTEDNVLPGNNGLKDQVLALKWINENIEHFRGDPQKVTLFGQSAGSVSVLLHLLSPLSKGLFIGAIAQSGSVLAAWAVAKPGEMYANTKKLAELLKCPTTSNAKMVKCLKHVDAYDIVKQDNKFYVFGYDPMAPYMPVVEKATSDSFLTADPAFLIESEQIARVPLMTGLASEDGGIKTAGILNDPASIELLDRDFDNLMPIILKYDERSTKITKFLRKFYFHNQPVNNATTSQLTHLFTDYLFALPVETLVRKLARYYNRPIYYYVFGFRGGFSFGSTSTSDLGVLHCDELYYLLSRDYFKNFELIEDEKRVRELMVTLWTNFAKFGNPTKSQPLVWNPVNSEDEDFLYIRNHNDVTMSKSLFNDRMEFWNNLRENNVIKNEL